MRSNEFLFESAESIISYLLLMGINIGELEHNSVKVIAQYESNPTLKEALKNALFTINIALIRVISSDIWDRFTDDLEVADVYNRFANLYNTNDDYLNSLL